MIEFRDEQLIRRLDSIDLGTRLLALNQLFPRQQGSLQWYFLRQTQDQQEAHRLTQELYLKMHKRLQKAPLKAYRPQHYISRMATNLARDQQRSKKRRQAKETDYDEAIWYGDQGMLSPEEEYELRNLAEQAYDLVLCLPSAKDRILMLLNLAKILPEQVPHLFPAFGSRSTVYRHLLRIRAQLRDQMARSNAVPRSPSEWEEKLSFTGVNSVFTISRFNTMPRNLSPESERELCRAFGLTSYNQVFNACFPILAIHEVGAFEPTPRIVFLPRDEVGWAIREGKQVHYLDAKPVFHRERVNGVQQELLHLEDIIEYPSWMLQEVHDHQGNLMGSVWKMDVPDNPFVAYKAFDLQKHLFFSDPFAQEEAIFVFQPAHTGITNQSYPVPGVFLDHGIRKESVPEFVA